VEKDFLKLKISTEIVEKINQKNNSTKIVDIF